MREILFRGKRIDNGEWITGGIFQQKADDVKDEVVYIIDNSSNDVDWAHRVIPETVGQFTGVTDKKGNRVFEGSIFRYEPHFTTEKACSEAEMVNYNMSKQADYFECERKITVYNARTDNIVLEAEGYMSISNNTTNELVITVKTGENSYKKNYVYLNEYTMYAVEDITGTHTDPYHYKLYWYTHEGVSIEAK